MRAREWADAADAARVFHLRQDERQDYDFLARTAAGRSRGIVLSGGGSRAYAHVGALRRLREEGLVFDFVGGASMGAIVAAGLSYGWSQDELEHRIRKAFVDSSPLDDWTLPVVAMTRGRKVDKRLIEHFGDTSIEELARPFFCVSSNLKDGSTYIHRTGRVRDALRASIAVPGLLPPVVEGDNVLVDGAVFSNFPAREMRAMHRGVTLGCDVTRNIGLDPADFTNPPNFFQWVLKNGFSEPPPVASLLMRAATVGVIEQHAALREAVDLIVLPELDLDLRNWKRFDEAVEAGYVAADALLDSCDAGALAKFKDRRSEPRADS